MPIRIGLPLIELFTPEGKRIEKLTSFVGAQLYHAVRRSRPGGPSVGPSSIVGTTRMMPVRAGRHNATLAQSRLAMPARHTRGVETTARIVTSLPLVSLWDERGTILAAARTRMLGSEDVRQLLRDCNELKFVVADVGLQLEWIDPSGRFSFWNDELAPHLGEPSADALYLEDFPGSYFYRASEWRLDTGDVIVLAEKQH